MGLDMYLNKKTYVKNWDHMKDEDRHQVVVIKNGEKVEHIETDRIAYVVEEVMYWRKANHIHKFFVDNAQGGEDDCREYHVDRELLELLVNKCKAVLALETEDRETEWTEVGADGKLTEVKKMLPHIKQTSVPMAEALLPTASGFFFGGTEYDSWYLEQCRETVRVLEAELNKKDDRADFYYRASW